MIGKDEEPGLLKLLNPVKREGKPDLADIELWPRCVPDGMIFKVRERAWCCLTQSLNDLLTRRVV